MSASRRSARIAARQTANAEASVEAPPTTTETTVKKRATRATTRTETTVKKRATRTTKATTVETTVATERKRKRVTKAGTTSKKAARTNDASDVATSSSRPARASRTAQSSAQHSTAPPEVQKSIQRALQQRMYLIRRAPSTDEQHTQVFHVLGATNHGYDVKISTKPSCNCPGWIFKRHLPCKHMLFVFLKVLRVPPTDPMLWRMTLTKAELERILSQKEDNAEILASASVRRQLNQQLGYTDTTEDDPPTTNITRRPIADDCPICYEELLPEEADQITWCWTSCGNNVHIACFDRWSQFSSSGQPTCVYCRAPWHVSQTTNANVQTKGTRGKFRYPVFVTEEST